MIKICGLLEPADAEAAGAAGADMVGVIFASAWRQRSLTEARAIYAAAGPDVERVGVFADAALEEVRAAIDACGLHHVQLGGHESPEYCAALGDLAVKTLRLPADAGRFDAYDVPLFHLDTAHAVKAGGTGDPWDYALARPLTDRFPVLLSGGLRPDNVAAAIEAARPRGVDVSSGVETRRRKDPDKIASFVRRAQAAFEALCEPA